MCSLLFVADVCCHLLLVLFVVMAACCNCTWLFAVRCSRCSCLSFVVWCSVLLLFGNVVVR